MRTSRCRQYLRMSLIDGSGGGLFGLFRAIEPMTVVLVRYRLFNGVDTLVI